MAGKQRPAALDSWRLVFAGTPGFAAGHLQALLDAGANVVGVYTQPDRPSGRGRKLTPSPVKRLAEQVGIAVFQPDSMKDRAVQRQLADLAPDLLVVVAYGLILPAAVLNTPSLACVNVHASLLPRWRGAAPFQRAVEAGDSVAGITVMQMDEGLDTGPMLAAESIALDPTMSAGDLHDRLAAIGPPLLLRVLRDLPAMLQNAQPQDDSAATYARMIDKAEARIDWCQSAAVLARKIMALNPRPGAWTTLANGERLKLLRVEVLDDGTIPAAAMPADNNAVAAAHSAAHSAKPAAMSADDGSAPGRVLSVGKHKLAVTCGEGALLVKQAQLPGARPITTAQLLDARGDLLRPGAVLGQ